jgi:hypothetical protein
VLTPYDVPAWRIWHSSDHEYGALSCMICGHCLLSLSRSAHISSRTVLLSQHHARHSTLATIGRREASRANLIVEFLRLGPLLPTKTYRCQFPGLDECDTCLTCASEPFSQRILLPTISWLPSCKTKQKNALCEQVRTVK